MDNLEKKLIDLPKHKLKLSADFKIRGRLYKMLILKKLSNFFNPLAFKGFILNKAIIVGLMVFLILGSTSLYAYGSEQVTLGNKLYPLKITVENVRNSLISSSVAKTKNYNSLSARRLEEALVLSNQEVSYQQEANDRIAQTIDKAVASFGQSVATAKKIKNPEESKKAAIKLKENSDNNLQVLEEIEKNINIKEHQDITKKISEAKEVIKGYDSSFEDNRLEESDKHQNQERKPQEENKEQKN